MGEPAIALAASPAGDDDQDRDHVVVLRGATWSDYRRMLRLRGDRPVPRFAYLGGELEIMSPSRLHESIKSMVGRLVEAWCMERGIDITPYGSWTLESQTAERAVEPDECYVVGARDAKRPHLAIEVVRTSGGLRKLDIYRKLGVREVWTWRRGAIEVHLLRRQRYERVRASHVLRGIDVAELLRFVDVRPMTKAVRAYRTTLR